MTLTLVVVGLVLAPPTGWLLGGWLADLTAGSQAGQGELQVSEAAISLSKDATSIPTGGSRPVSP